MVGTRENPAKGLADLLWNCPATRNAEPAERGHRFRDFYRSDPHELYQVYCERCGHNMAYVDNAPEETK